MASNNPDNLPAVPEPPSGQVLIYEDGALDLQVRIEGETAWLTQAQMAEMYQTTPQNITLHIRAIYEEKEQAEAATCKEFLQVRSEGKRTVQRRPSRLAPTRRRTLRPSHRRTETGRDPNEETAKERAEEEGQQAIRRCHKRSAD